DPGLARQVTGDAFGGLRGPGGGIRVDAQEDSVAILADRLGVDARDDLRPAVAVAAGAGALLAAQAAWARADRPDDLPRLIGQAFDALAGELFTRPPGGRAPHRTTEESRDR
ncbi:acyl-CoA-like ligand-binding transcription factor, partial [Streptomyces sp. NPDC001274]